MERRIKKLNKKMAAWAIVLTILLSMIAIPIKPIGAENIIIVPDDYPTIQQAVNAANWGDTIFVKKDTYNERVTVDKPLTLLGEDRDRTIIETTIISASYIPIIYITSNDVTVKNFTIQKGDGVGISKANSITISENHIRWSEEYGIYMGFSEGNIIENNIIEENYGGILVTSKNVIRDNTIESNEIGVWGVCKGGNILQGNELINNTRSFVLTWDYPPSLSDCMNDIDTSNTIDGKPIYYMVNHESKTVPEDAGYIVLVDCTGILVKDLNLTRNSPGILVAFSTECKLENLKIHDVWSPNNPYGIQTIFSQKISISRNLIEGAVGAWDSNGINITRNTITPSGEITYGIYLRNSDSCRITDNDCNMHACIYGGRLQIWGTHNLVAKNVVRSGSIELSRRGSSNRVEFNELIGGVGIHIDGKSHVVCRNRISDGGGIVLAGPLPGEEKAVSNNLIFENEVVNSGCGILGGGVSNKIYHNNFINNAIQAKEHARTSNYYDDGYPSGGNYWSDHEFVDEYSGSNQDIPGSDGICDTPYIIEGYHQDKYPLMKPFSLEHVIEIVEIKYQPWNLINNPFADISEARDYVEHFVENDEPEEEYGTIPMNITLTNTGSEPAENVVVEATISGVAALASLDESNIENDYVHIHPFEYPYFLSVGTINPTSTVTITLDMPVKYASIFAGIFKYNEEDEVDILFIIIELDVSLEISGDNTNRIQESRKARGVVDPFDLTGDILYGILSRLKDKMLEDVYDLIEEYILSIVLGATTESFTAIAGQKHIFDTTIQPDTTSFTISTLLPAGVSLVQLALTIGALTIGITSTAVYGFATLIVKPPGLQPGDAKIIIETASPDVTFTLTVIKISERDTTKPVANAGGDQTVDEDTVVTFDASASYDDVDIVECEWTFTNSESKTLTGANPIYVFERPGTYIVTLKVSDEARNYDTDTVTITVFDVTKPTANFGYSTSDLMASLDASESFDNVGIVEYKWDFGDGNSGTGMVTTHAYSEPGNYNVSLTVKDAAENSDEISISVTATSDEGVPFLWMLLGIVGVAVAGIGLAGFYRIRTNASKRKT